MNYILIIYLSTVSLQSGMTMASTEFTNEERCHAAEKVVKEKFNSFGTNVRTVCVQK